MPNLPDQTTLESQLLELLSERILDQGVIVNRNTDLQSIGLDSLATMQLLLLIERQYGVTLADTQISCSNLGSVKTIAKLLKLQAAVVQ